MKSIDVTRTIPAPRSAVWAVLADYPNIADWNSGIKVSYSTSESSGGVGAKRHCDLAPMGELEETIAEWEPEERLVINIDSAAKLPLKSGRATFTLAGDGDSTETGIHYEYEPSRTGKVMGPVLGKQLERGFVGFLADLDAAAQQGTSAASAE